MGIGLGSARARTRSSLAILERDQTQVFRADAQDDYADIGALEVSAYTPQRGTFGKDSAVVNRRIRKDGITTIENIQLSIAKSAYNQAEFVTLFVRGSDGQWSVGVARFKRVR